MASDVVGSDYVRLKNKERDDLADKYQRAIAAERHVGKMGAITVVGLTIAAGIVLFAVANGNGYTFSGPT